MMKHSRLLSSPLCAPLVLVAAAVAACGGSVSGNGFNQEGDGGSSSSGGSSGSSGGSSGSSSGATTSSGSGGSSGGGSGSSSSGGSSGSSSGATSSGSGVIAVPLQACLPLVYTANVTVGSQTFAMNLDTGSTSLGVASTTCGSTCGVTPEYTPGATAVDKGTMATSQYGSGSWTGEVYQDSVGFASDPMIPLDFVAIDTQSMFFTGGIQCGASGQGYQGIIGFDRASAAVAGTNAFFDQYVLAKGIANVFATELCDSGGTLWLGGYDATAATAPPQYTPVTTDVASTYYYTVDLETITVAGTTTPVTIAVGQYPDTVVDTGTSGFVVPTAAFNSLASAIAGTSGFQQAFGAGAGAAWFSSQAPCGAATMTKAQIDATLPALTLQFGTAPGMTIQVAPSESYLMQYGNYGWCSTMIQIQQGQQFPLAAIMGAPFLRSQITIYDRGSNQIGFAPHTACP